MAGAIAALLSPVMADRAISAAPTLACQIAYGVETSNPKVAVSARRAGFAGALQNGFGIQYWGETYTASELAEAPHGVLIIEATKLAGQHSASWKETLFTPDELRTMTHDGARPVLAYLNVAEVELYRDYWLQYLRDLAVSERPPRDAGDWLGPRTDQGEQLAQFWQPSWEAILNQRLDRLMDAGFSGIFIDDVLSYYNFATGAVQDWPNKNGDERPDGANAYARAMMALVIRLSARARSRNENAIIVVNNGIFIGRDAGPDAEATSGSSMFDRYREVLDGIVVEGVFAPAVPSLTAEVMRSDFGAAGVAVMSVDFAEHFSDLAVDEIAACVASRAWHEGFTPYVADDQAFNRLYPAIAEQRVVASGPR